MERMLTLSTTEEEKPKLIATKIWKCKNPECKAWVREEFAESEQSCPICKGPMHRSMRHLPKVQNKIKRQPRKPKSEFDI
ncbi:cold-inducible protein YdjO-related protein [Paenibacillus sp. R14(2021)]|uniref:cold-inducible protein YdjO-related protein n=1 Tax=Paenibacillus sp. R14(2021) TaxID=2859228 RepID=UPI001C616221|nr:cold-inducible protein YdjO-related protein [Paenibacillus sp. R14(2021)]